MRSFLLALLIIGGALYVAHLFTYDRIAAYTPSTTQEP